METQGFTECKAVERTCSLIDGTWMPPTSLRFALGTLFLTLVRAREADALVREASDGNENQLDLTWWGDGEPEKRGPLEVQTRRRREQGRAVYGVGVWSPRRIASERCLFKDKLRRGSVIQDSAHHRGEDSTWGGDLRARETADSPPPLRVHP
jgi:hypothetical protein